MRVKLSTLLFRERVMANRAEEIVKLVVRTLSNWYTEPPWWLREEDPYRILIGILLANRTNYRIVRKHLPRFLSMFPNIETITHARLSELYEALRPFGLYKLRALMLRELAHRVKELGGLEKFLELDPDKARKLLLDIPGIGEKTADILLAALFGVDVFVVDTHILRIAKRLGLVPENYDIYRARRVLEPLIPRGKRLRTHLALIRIGREVCRPKRPRCSVCPLRNLCKYASRTGSN